MNTIPKGWIILAKLDYLVSLYIKHIVGLVRRFRKDVVKNLFLKSLCVDLSNLSKNFTCRVIFFPTLAL